MISSNHDIGNNYGDKNQNDNLINMTHPQQFSLMVLGFRALVARKTKPVGV